MSIWVDGHDEWSELENLNWDLEARSIQPYQRIMVVIDDTPSTPIAVRHAIRLARLCNAEIDFFAVLNVPAAAAMPDMLAITDDLINDLTKHNQVLLDWAADTAAYAGVSCRTHIQWGQIPGAILSLADMTQCDLIIMGTPAKCGWLRFLQPCIAKRVAIQARQPVLVIKESGTPSSVS